MNIFGALVTKRSRSISVVGAVIGAITTLVLVWVLRWGPGRDLFESLKKESPVK